jgi:hypothetical protein
LSPCLIVDVRDGTLQGEARIAPGLVQDLSLLAGERVPVLPGDDDGSRTQREQGSQLQFQPPTGAEMYALAELTASVITLINAALGARAHGHLR